MAKPGRKPKFTPERIEKILALLRAGNTQKTASEASGIDRATLIRWVHQDTNFAAAVKQAENDAEAAHVANIVTAAEKGSWQASAWWLERRRYQEWGRKDRLEVIQSVRDMARATNQDEDAAVRHAENILRELRSAQRT